MFRGFREFGEFLRAGEGISTNILTDRLRRLTSTGLVVQSDHPSDGKKFVYRLSEKGVDLAPILIELTLWGAKHFPDHLVPPEILGRMRTAPERFLGELRAGLLAELAPEGRAADSNKRDAALEHRIRRSQAVRRRTAKRLRKPN